MANNSIDIANLDFDGNRNSLIEFLKTQQNFKDYNFESSNIGVLLDILALNTYREAFYLNMIHSEGFLDSSQMRQSIFSKSKELNYLPRSSRSSVANIKIEFEASGLSQPYVIRKGETFTTLIKQDSYSFSVSEDIILTSQNSSFRSTFDIHEGIFTTDTYVVKPVETTQLFKITNKNIDTTSLSVLVYEKGSTTAIKYKKATTLLDLNEKSTIFFIQPSFEGGYEISFGDDIIGNRPGAGSTIVLDYRVTSGSLGNGAKTFTSNFDPTSAGELISSVFVTVNPFSESSSGAYSVNGAEAESNESIKYYAPRHFQVQERAITVSDYEVLLKTQFPEIGAVSVFGGDELNPPQYGKVFVAVDVKNVDGIPATKKREYFNFLKTRSPLTINPEFIDPAFTYISVASNVKFNINVTTRTESNLKAAIILAISQFSDNSLSNFKSNLRYSKLVKMIDDVDSSIIGNDTDIILYKKMKLKIGTPQNLNIAFNIELRDPLYIFSNISTKASSYLYKDTHSVYSSIFILNGEKCRIEDDGDGKLRIAKTFENKHLFIKNVGTVDYKKGILNIQNFALDSYDGSFFKIYVKSAYKDVEGTRNEILAIEPDEISVNMESIRE